MSAGDWSNVGYRDTSWDVKFNSNGAAGGSSNPLTDFQSSVNAAKASAGAAVGSAQSGVDAVLGAAAQARRDNQGIRDMVPAVQQQAGAVKDAAAAMLPQADTLRGYGDKLWDQGSALYEQAKDVFGQGGALVSMDPNAGGLAGEFIKYWQSLSPDRYVSQAASDTQASFQNAQGQAERDLARRGVSSTSGAAGGLRRTLGMALVTALASAKTKARQMGLDQQAAQLDKMVSSANTLYNMGNQTAQAALGAQNAGANAQNAAAGIIQGAGGLEGQAGQLFATAAGLFDKAAGNEVAIGNSIRSAYDGMASAQMALANFEASTAGHIFNAQNGGGGRTITTTFDKAAPSMPAGWDPVTQTSTYDRNRGK